MEPATVAPAIKRPVGPKVRAAVKKPAIGVKRKQAVPVVDAQPSDAEPAAVDKAADTKGNAAHVNNSGPAPASTVPAGLGLLGDYDSSDSEE